MRDITEALKAGGLPKTRSSTLSEAEALTAAIAELEYAITRLIAELKALQESDGFRLVVAAGATEADWQRFLEQQQMTLERELGKIMSDLMAVQTAE